MTAATVPDAAATGADEAWDRFVAAGNPGSYLQLSGWAAVKAVNGWTATRTLTAREGSAIQPAVAPIGAQILLRRPRPLPWAFAYAPRGRRSRIWAPIGATAGCMALPSPALSVRVAVQPLTALTRAQPDSWRYEPGSPSATN